MTTAQYTYLIAPLRFLDVLLAVEDQRNSSVAQRVCALALPA